MITERYCCVIAHADDSRRELSSTPKEGRRARPRTSQRQVTWIDSPPGSFGLQRALAGAAGSRRSDVLVNDTAETISAQNAERHRMPTALESATLPQVA
jgi:hypothetical protein